MFLAESISVIMFLSALRVYRRQDCTFLFTLFQSYYIRFWRASSCCGGAAAFMCWLESQYQRLLHCKLFDARSKKDGFCVCLNNPFLSVINNKPFFLKKRVLTCTNIKQRSWDIVTWSWFPSSTFRWEMQMFTFYLLSFALAACAVKKGTVGPCLSLCLAQIDGLTPPQMKLRTGPPVA